MANVKVFAGKTNGQTDKQTSKKLHVPDLSMWGNKIYFYYIIICDAYIDLHFQSHPLGNGGLKHLQNTYTPGLPFDCPSPPRWLSVEYVRLMTRWLSVRSPVEATFLFIPACFRLSPLQKHVRKVVGGFGKKSCVSTGVRKPGNTYASPTAMI